MVRPISFEETKPFILEIHYAKRMPLITFKFGLFKKDGVGLKTTQLDLFSEESLVGMVSYGSPPSPSLCKGVCGSEFKDQVLELNRLVLKDNLKNECSFLIAQSLKLLPKPLIIVSYADTSQKHSGIVYQATNFIYTGLSDKRTEWRMKNSDLHSKTICERYSLKERKDKPDIFYLINRPRKHRYIYFLGSKTQKKIYKKNLKYLVKPYEKENL